MKMAQVTVRTSRFEEEVAFYQEVVKLEVQREMHEGPLDIVFLADRKGETCMEIIRSEQADDVGNPFLSVGFETDDAETLRQKLLNQDYEPGEMESPAPVVRFFFVRDPAGVTVQFVEEKRFPSGQE